MKNRILATVLGLTLAGAVAPALAQPYGGYRDYGYDDRGPRHRDRDYDDRRDHRDFRDRRDDGFRGGGYAFDSGEYLRCNPDVRRAFQRGQISSAIEHYRVFGRREGRRLSC